MYLKVVSRPNQPLKEPLSKITIETIVLLYNMKMGAKLNAEKLTLRVE